MFSPPPPQSPAFSPREDVAAGPQITVVAAHENQVFRANGFRNALQKLSGNDDIKVALINKNTKALKVDQDSHAATLLGNVEGRKCIIVSVRVDSARWQRPALWYAQS